MLGLVAVTEGFLLAAEFLDELGVCATASMDTKPITRKKLIIIINFFITLKFLGLKVTVKTSFPLNCLMTHDNFPMSGLSLILHSQQIKSFCERSHRDFNMRRILITMGKNSMPNHII